jgi:hypothetical protein
VKDATLRTIAKSTLGILFGTTRNEMFACSCQWVTILLYLVAKNIAIPPSAALAFWFCYIPLIAASFFLGAIYSCGPLMVAALLVAAPVFVIVLVGMQLENGLSKYLRRKGKPSREPSDEQ